MAEKKISTGRRAVANAETRERMLSVAERLFASEGIDSVSLRQIGTTSGAANHFAVQYHFGDKRNLVRAIFEHRLPRLETRRSQLFEKLKRENRLGDPCVLLEILLRPLADEVDADGTHSHAAFLLGLHHRGQYEERASASDLAPLASQVSELIHAANSPVALEVSRFRLMSAFALFLDALVRIDRLRAKTKLTNALEASLVEDAVSSAKGAFSAP